MLREHNLKSDDSPSGWKIKFTIIAPTLWNKSQVFKKKKLYNFTTQLWNYSTSSFVVLFCPFFFKTLNHQDLILAENHSFSLLFSFVDNSWFLVQVWEVGWRMLFSQNYVTNSPNAEPMQRKKTPKHELLAYKCSL